MESCLENPEEHKYSCALCSYSTIKPHHYKNHLISHTSAQPFKCPKCPYKTKWKGSVKKHVKVVHLLRSPSSRPFPCPESGCKYAAKRNSELKNHLKTHSNEKVFFCFHPNCNFSANFKHNLTIHARTHTGEKPYVCQFESCAYASTQLGNLQQHTRTHTQEKPYTCSEPNCEFSATAKSNLYSHQLTEHPKEGEERTLFKCPLCEYSGKSKKRLSTHVKSHTLEKHFKCDEPNCNFEAKTKSNLKAHQVVHSDEKPFACSFESCTFRCKTKSDLLKHLERHNDEKRYKCELCPYRGKTRDVVTSHLKSVHSDLRPFKCTIPHCDSTFKNKGHLNYHLLVHKGDKKYSCQFLGCDYKAVTKTMVQNHVKSMHETEKKLKCQLCLFTTKTQRSLASHVRTHTKEKPYSCKEKGCGFQGKTSSAVQNHHKLKHKAPPKDT